MINSPVGIRVLIPIGYLGYDAATETAFIPNEEVRLIRNAVEDCGWLDTDGDGTHICKIMKYSER